MRVTYGRHVPLPAINIGGETPADRTVAAATRAPRRHDPVQILVIGVVAAA